MFVRRKPSDRLPEFGGRVVREAADAEIADSIAAGEQEVPGAVNVAGVAEHGRNLNDLADQLNLLRFPLPFVPDQERNRLAGLSVQQGHGVAQRHPVRRGLADAEDAVAGENARPIGRRADQRTEDRQLLRLGIERQLHSHAGELKIDALLKLGQVGGGNIGRIIVQLAEHPVHGAVEQRRVLDRLEGSILDRRHGVGQDAGIGIPLHALVAHQRHERHDQQNEQITSRHGRSLVEGHFAGSFDSGKRPSILPAGVRWGKCGT